MLNKTIIICGLVLLLAGCQTQSNESKIKNSEVPAQNDKTSVNLNQNPSEPQTNSKNTKTLFDYLPEKFEQAPKLEAKWYEEIPEVKKLSGSFLPQKGEEFLRKNFLDPLEQFQNLELEKRDLMSRCASGARYSLNQKPTENDPYFYGKAWINKGCYGSEPLDFRVKNDGSQIEILDPKTNQHVDLKTWAKTAEKLKFKNTAEKVL